MFLVLMIVLNGLLDLTPLIGGFRHYGQEYNLPGARAYLGVLFPLAVLGRISGCNPGSVAGGIRCC
jgi:Ca2+:H+ antiporter